MTVRIGHASIDENKQTHGGAAGDQTGKEVCVRTWYKHAKGWVLLRCKDAAAREKIAQAMEKACVNAHIGYDQYQRDTLYNHVKDKGFDPSKTTKFVETDCSALVRVCIAYAFGRDVAGNIRTVNEPAALVATGQFEKLTAARYCEYSDYLMRGDILCTPVSGHTVVVLDNGARAGNTTTSTTSTNKKEGYTVNMKTLKKGDKGAQVETLQALLRGHGCKADNGKLPAKDGDFGTRTGQALAAYQRTHKDTDGKQLKDDQECGPKTWASLLGQ